MDDKKIDWLSFDLPQAGEYDLTPKSGKLSQLDYWKLYLASVAIEKSIAQTLQTAIITYLDRNFDKHLERLAVLAKQKGMTLDELIQELINAEYERKQKKIKKH